MKQHCWQYLFATLWAGLFLTGTCAAESLLIGANLPLSGKQQADGMTAQKGIEMLVNEVNARGGLAIGGKKYTLQPVFVDNKSTPEGATSAAMNLIATHKVLGIVGPLMSSNAIAAASICDSFKAPMISPTSTNPKTTLDHPFVFRACFLDNFQGQVMARFAINDLKASKAAVLFDGSSSYPRGLAEFFKSSFEAKMGQGSVVAYEAFLPNEKDLSAYLHKIVQSGAEVLFVPQYANDIPAILQQASKAGWDKPVLGGDAWESADLVTQCGALCTGAYFSTHFAAVGAKGKAATFVSQFKKTYNETPTGFSALSYDAADLLVQAISNLPAVAGNVMMMRGKIKENLVHINGLKGVSGEISLNEKGNPVKSAVVIQINNQGEFAQYKQIMP